MRAEKRLTVTINRPLDEVFSFIVDPRNTPKWISEIVHEEVTELPLKVGAVYLPQGEGGVSLGRYPVTQYEHNKTFTYTKEGAKYFAQYTFSPIDETTTKFDYYAWDEESDLNNDPVTEQALQKLKVALENGENSL
ncbi:MAG TPA: SRPBCC family protein [Verrucomicrobiae bacterium]|nr:SRPBCC family protein [Verrucomicrobiae bacterium]